MKIEELSIEEKVGQMIMIGLDTPHAIDIVDDLILKYKIGGIISLAPVATRTTSNRSFFSISGVASQLS